MEKSSTEEMPAAVVVVALNIGCNVSVEIDATGVQTLVLSDGKVEVRAAVPAARDGDEYPWMHVRRLALRIEEEATEARRNTLAWHGPVNGPGGWM